jgi:RHS repeat-associated protein
VDRLVTAQSPSAATWGDSYVYDAWGNLLQKNVTKGTAESMALTINAKNQVTTPAFTYDAAGHVTSDTTVAMTYDAEGRMNPTSGTTYTYDGDGRRVKKSDGTVYWVDDSFRPLSVGTTTGSITRDYVFLGQKRIAHVTISSGNAYYYLSDHLGSTAVVASGDGKTIQWEADYFPFGSERQVFTSTAGVSYQFTGYEYDSDTQYNYAVARFEAGRWGRFMSPDPYLGSMNLGTPQSLNKYAHVENDPIDFIDPLGLNKTSIIIVGNCIVQQVYGSEDGRPYLISSTTIFCGSGGGSTTGGGNGGGTPADMWGITDPTKRNLFNCTAAANQQFNANSKNQTPTPPPPSQVFGLSGPSIAGTGTSVAVGRLLGGTATRGVIGYVAKVFGTAVYDLTAGAVEATKNFIGYNSIDNQTRAACHTLFGN